MMLMANKEVAKLCILALLGAVFVLPTHVLANDALLFISPSTATITVGETFTVSVVLDAGDGEINASEGSLTFNPDDIEFVSVSTAGSIFASWLTEPRFVPATNSVDFSGSLPNGFSGTAGKIMDVTFRALTNTNTQIWFSSGAAVLAADGKGSNVLSQLRSGSYTLAPRSVTPSLAASVGQSLDGLANAAAVAQPNNISGPGASNIITSTTHPDQDRWYSTTTALLRWNLPESVTALRTLLNDSPKTRPQKQYTDVISQIAIRDLDQGTSYFHLQLRDAEGWGDIYHFALNVDTETPKDLNVEEIPRNDETDPNISFMVEAVDDISGIDHYEFSIDGGKPIIWGDDEGNGIFAPDTVRPGEHTMRVAVVDKAGNKALDSITFTVEALDSPLITDSPDSLFVGDVLTVRGETYENADIDAYVSYDGNEAQVRTISSDATGAFVFTAADPARGGTYEIWFEAIDQRGARSNPSEQVSVQVNQPTFLLFGTVAVSYMSVLLPLLGAVIVLGLLIWLGWYLYRRMTGRVGKETQEAQELLHESFTQLKMDVRRHVKMLLEAENHRRLTVEEEHMLAELVGHFDETEEELSKEIGDIEATAHARPEETVAYQPLKIQKVR